MTHLMSALAEPRVAPPADLEALRAEIDNIDEALLGLMERRLAWAAAVADIKEKEQPIQLRLRPDRERTVLDRLCRRAGRLPEPVVRTIWRELMGLSLQAQKRTEIVLCAPRRGGAVTDGARLRFGCQAPMLVAETAEEALARARTHEAIAVIELDPLSNWWVGLAHDHSLTIFDHLQDAQGRIMALIVGRVASDDQRKQPAYPILTETALGMHSAEGDMIRVLALSGGLRLCIAEGTRNAVGPSR
jgi:chorismate mutase/prephenate dehydratase